MNDLAIGREIVGHSRWSTHCYLVYGHIVDTALSHKYILIKEKPRDSVPDWKHLPYDSAQNVFKKHPFSQYYIYERMPDSLHGPFNRDKYLEMRSLIGVPDDLKLK